MADGQDPRQRRSRHRRESLLRAAIELLAEGGVKAVTARAVADRAAVPLAATTYYFDSIQQLTDEALQLGVAERVVELESLTEVAPFAGRSAEEFIEQFVNVLVTRPAQELVAQYEVYLEAARNPALRKSVAASIRGFEQIATNAMAALGGQNPERYAKAVLAMLDGFALHRVANPMPIEQEAELVIDALHALFVAQVADEDDKKKWRELLQRPLPSSSAE